MKLTIPKFDCSKNDSDLIHLIVKRARKMDPEYDGLTCDMDLSACHNSCPLDLKRLLAADDFNFAHDVFGIRRHINRTTGQLMDCFVPRFTRLTPAEKQLGADLAQEKGA